jgi:hypothetical protein
MQTEVKAFLLDIPVLLKVRMPLAIVMVHYIRFYSKYRLDPLFARLVVECLCGEQVAVVGHGKGRHAKRLCLLDKRFYSALPVEKRIRRV